MEFDGSLASENIGALWLLVLSENNISWEGRHDLSIDGVLKTMPRDGCHLRSIVIGRFRDSLESTCFKSLMFPTALWAKLLIDMIVRENPETYVQ